MCTIAFPEFSDALRRAVQTDIMVTFKREGDCIKQETLMGNDLVYQINETREWKDREVDTQLHIKVNENTLNFGNHFYKAK